MNGKRILPYIGWSLSIGLVSYLVSQHPVFVKQGMQNLSIQMILTLGLFNILSNASQGIAFYYVWPDGNLSIWKHAMLPSIMHSANIIFSFRFGESTGEVRVGARISADCDRTATAPWSAAGKT